MSLSSLSKNCTSALPFGGACAVIAEIGINHNGSLELAKKLIDAAADCGCDAVKFQKRTVEVVYSAEELAKPRESPFGTTNGDLKRGLEFGAKEYAEIDRYCRSKGIPWFASCWDEDAVDFLEPFELPCYKIASASLTDDALLLRHARIGAPLILSTGMSRMDQIERAVALLQDRNLVLMHCTSTYPTNLEELNLRCISTLQETFHRPVGYSGHEVGVATSYAAAVLGACAIERHLTLDRAMWGSDQAASLEPPGMSRLVRDIRELPTVLGDGVKKVYDSELPIIKKLRRLG